MRASSADLAERGRLRALNDAGEETTAEAVRLRGPLCPTNYFDLKK